jgi:hypothetical protein
MSTSSRDGTSVPFTAELAPVNLVAIEHDLYSRQMSQHGLRFLRERVNGGAQHSEHDSEQRQYGGLRPAATANKLRRSRHFLMGVHPLLTFLLTPQPTRQRRQGATSPTRRPPHELLATITQLSKSG